MTWTQAMLADLTRLWGEGHGSGEISKRVRMSSDSCLAMVHRLDLPRHTLKPRAKPQHKLLPWNPPHPGDPDHKLDDRALKMFDALAGDMAVPDVAAAFRLPACFVREMWRVYQLQDVVGVAA